MKNIVRYLVPLILCAACASHDTTAPKPQPPQIVFDGVMNGGSPQIYLATFNDTSFVVDTVIPLTGGDATNIWPTAANGLVVYVSGENSTFTMIQIDTKTSTTGPISIVGNAIAEPALSPDGSQLAYLNTNAMPRVWVAQMSGSIATQFAPTDSVPNDTGNFSGAIEDHPAWSPDGTRIAYVSTRFGNADIFVAADTGAQGSATLVVGGAGDGNNVEPTWSPDGTQIAFASDRSGQTDLYTVTLATGAVTQLTTEGNVGQPTWLADGRIVFTQMNNGTSTLQWIDASSPATVNTLSFTGITNAEHAAGVIF